jgi:hypothetical protein
MRNGERDQGTTDHGGRAFLLRRRPVLPVSLLLPQPYRLVVPLSGSPVVLPRPSAVVNS